MPLAMKMPPLLLLAATSIILFTRAAWADDEMRNVQTELKNQGFYYGEIDGKLSSETSASIKRYQIRNGLEVTGTLTRQTLESLGVVRPEARPSSPPTSTPAPATPEARPPTHLRRESTEQESDRSFLRREENSRPRSDDPSIVSPPVPLDPTPAPGEEYEVVFERTPYATAPREVQEITLRKAQTLLAREGFYRDDIDGAPGPATEEALLIYQRRIGLPLTGRLDLRTLAQMRLLPTRAIEPPMKPFFGGRRTVPQRTYRGIWID
jgi:peptidoglycan hydrolase-like protein with peptidoglycan-binding domain